MILIYVFSYVIAVLGTAAVALLLKSAFEMLYDRRKKFDTAAGFAEILPYSMIIEDGIVLNKDGSLSVGFEYVCDDSDSSTDDDQDVMMARLNQALVTLGDGWAAHIDAVRINAEKYSKKADSFFPDPISAAIDEERRRFFNGLGVMYETKFVAVFTYTPDLLLTQKFLEMMYEKQKTGNDGKDAGAGGAQAPRPATADGNDDRTADILRNFKAKVREIESLLAISVKTTRLHSYRVMNEDGSYSAYDSLLAHFNFCITGINQPILLPDTPVYLDHILASKDFITGTVPKIGDNFIRCISIDGFPMATYAGILNKLVKLDCTYRWSTRFLFTSPHTALNEIGKYQRKWKQKERGIIAQLFNLPSSNVNYDAVAMTEDANDFSAEVNSGNVGAGYYSSVLVLMSRSANVLSDDCEKIFKEISNLGFTARIETVNCIESYLGSLPADVIHNIRRPLIHTMNLAHLMPTTSIWTGTDKCPCPFYPENAPALMYAVTDGSSPFRLNLHVRDLGHTLILGPTGAGKSTLLATLAAQFRRYRGMSIFAFDKGMSMYALCKACGGSHFEICADDSDLSFCPLQYNRTPAERENCVEWLLSILQLNAINGNGVVTPEQIDAVRTAVESMYNTNRKTLSDFFTAVQNYEVKTIIKNYCGNSLMGATLDGKNDNLELSDFTVFEMEEIMNQPDKNRIPILLYLFRRIQDGLRGQPAVIILDEAWIMLSNEVFREKIREWLKVLRKANCAVIMATQSISDALGSGIMDVIAESTATKIFLPNSTAKNEDTAEMYRKLGLNSRQIEIIANAVPKRDYYFVSSEGRRLFSLALGKLTLSFVAVSDKENIQKIKQMERDHGAAWPSAWLAARKISLNLNDYASRDLYDAE